MGDYNLGVPMIPGLNKATVGLANVDNTTDALKPISSAQQTALNLKANKTQGSWIAPTLLNSWVNYDAIRPARYFKDELGFVHIEGLVKLGTVGTSTPIFILPAGYRSLQYILHYLVNSNGAVGILEINDSGNVYLVSGSNAYVSITLPPFRAEQ